MTEITIACNYLNDLYRDSDGNIATNTGLYAIAQNCRTAMQVWLGECVLNVTRGIPFEATVFDRYQPAQFQAAARKIILAVDGVNSIESFSVSQSGKIMSYTVSISTDYGSTTVNG